MTITRNEERCYSLVDLLRYLEYNDDDILLVDKEVSSNRFIKSVHNYFNRTNRLSKKQEIVLVRIINEILIMESFNDNYKKRRG
jgi:hypothetical protein